MVVKEENNEVKIVLDSLSVDKAWQGFNLLEKGKFQLKSRHGNSDKLEKNFADLEKKSKDLIEKVSAFWRKGFGAPDDESSG